jgi:tetratricopeptide (TPR) repeat protein
MGELLNKLFQIEKRVQMLATLALTLSVMIGATVQSADAARKYYPPGFNPAATDDDEIPVSLPSRMEPQQSIQPPAPIVVKQIIIKNVTVPVAAKPRDPLTVLLDSHRYYDALLLVENRLKKSPGNFNLLMTRAFLLREQGQFVAAIEQYDNLLIKNLSPANRAAAWNGLGWACYQKALQDWRTGASEGEDLMLQAARNAFKQSVEIVPHQPWAWAGLARTELAAKHPKAAQLALNQAMHVKSADLSVDLAHADILLAQRRYADALQLLYGVKNPATVNADVFLFLARASLALDKTDDAIIDLKQLLELEPNHTEALKLLSQAYAVKMKPENASQSLETAVALNPGDVKSVQALLKIYDAEGDIERGSLLLKSLLKTNPSQVEYVQALLERLIRKNRWRTAYEEGSQAIPGIITQESFPSATADSAVPAVSEFGEAVYYRARSMLDTRSLLNEPAVQSIAKFTRAHEAQLSKTLAESPTQATPEQVSLLLQDRRTLLFLNPLEKVPPVALLPISNGNLAVALQIAFLSGDKPGYQNLMLRTKKLAVPDNTQAGDSSLPISGVSLQEIARQLYNVGDYHGAHSLLTIILTKNPKLEAMQAMEKDVLEVLRDIDEQRIALQVLANKTSNLYWDKMAGQTLRTANGDWRTHALLGTLLTKKHRPALAAVQQQLAHRFAPPEEKQRFIHERAKD